jgi:alpha-galactosidase
MICQMAAPSLAPRKPKKRSEAVKLSCNRRSGECLLRWADGTTLGPIAASVQLVDGTKWTTSDLPRHEVKNVMGSPAGLATDGTREVVIRHYGRPGAPELLQHIYLPPGQPYALMDLEAIGTGPLSSRHISPVVLAAGGSARFAVRTRPTVLFVPNDNDMWVHYNEPIDPTKDPDSYEVTAVFDNASRKGMVLGSVTHDLWRTGVLARDLGDGTAGVVEVYGGATGQWTHDVDPHGVVTSKTLRSPLVMVGYFSDWRDGMETYGSVNARIHPPLAWSEGVPFGWNSWSAYLQKIDKTRYLAVADFLHSELEPRGFKNDGTVYVNLDGGWNAMPDADVIASAKHIHAQGQKAGIYFTPFSYWSDDFSKPVEGTNGKYTYADILLRDAKGNPLPKIDGARPLDPTHPGTIARIDYELARFVAWGYDSVKLDFLNCGSLEGHHYDPAITTGVAAYAYGMQRIEDDLSPKKIGRPFFLSLSIAPLFPAYGHSRRVSCDAFGRIEDSEYLLNASTFGWWTNGTLYRFNDPDHTVISRDTDPYHGQSLAGSVQTLDEARTRVDASVITGTVLLDSDDLMEARAQARAKELLTNEAILNVARAGRAFRPVEGDSGEHAANIFTRTEPDGSMYVAVFNYSESKSTELKLDLARLGLSGEQAYRATDLWTGTSREISGSIEMPLGPAQSTILHLAKR